MVFINQISLNNKQDDMYRPFNKSENYLNVNSGNKQSKERDDGTNHNKRAYTQSKPDETLDNGIGS